MQMVCSSARRSSLQPITTFRTPSYMHTNKQYINLKWGEDNEHHEISTLMKNETRKNSLCRKNYNHITNGRERELGHKQEVDRPVSAQMVGWGWGFVLFLYKSRHDCPEREQSGDGSLLKRRG